MLIGLITPAFGAIAFGINLSTERSHKREGIGFHESSMVEVRKRSSSFNRLTFRDVYLNNYMEFRICICCQRSCFAKYVRCVKCRRRRRKPGEKYTVNTTKADMIVVYKSINRGQINAKARQLYKEDLKTAVCKYCNYSKHVHVCHIKAIRDFSLDATLNEINDRSNIIFLCPNCHWEFDHLPRNNI